MTLNSTILGLALLMTIAHVACTGSDAQGESGEEVTKEQYDLWMTELSNWGRWGDDDQLGALNLITPAKRIEAAGLVRHGTTVSMARPISLATPDPTESSDGNRPPLLGGNVRTLFDIDHDNGYFWERYEIEYHGSLVSHLDALCHVAYNGKVYNGFDFQDVASTTDGCSRLGIANLKNGLVTRGILIDMPGTSVRRQDIESWEADTGITIASGDALFLRTGRDVGEDGGYHPSLMPFFKERDIALLGVRCTTRRWSNRRRLHSNPLFYTRLHSASTFLTTLGWKNWPPPQRNSIGGNSCSWHHHTVCRMVLVRP